MGSCTRNVASQEYCVERDTFSFKLSDFEDKDDEFPQSASPWSS